MKCIRSIVAYAATGVVLAWLLLACSPSSRQTTINTALTAANASQAAFVAYDAKHQTDIVASAKDGTSGQLALVEYRATQLKIEQGFTLLYQAIASAASLNTDASLANIVTQAAAVAAQLKSIGALP